MPRKRTYTNPKPSIPPPLVQKTEEMKMDEARKEVMDRMLDPKNISPEKMPSFANLDSYSSLMDDDEPEDNGGVVEMATEPPPGKETKELKPNVESSGNTYVEVAPPPKKRTNNFENLKVYDKLKEEIREEKDRSKALEDELEDVKRQLDEAIREKNEALERARNLESKVESARGMVDRKKFEKVVSENEDLLLRNSELELEASLAKESLRKASCQKASQEHTYSPRGYSKVQEVRDTRRSMNGYEDWI